MTRTDDESNRIEVSAYKATVKDGPAFDDQEITPEYEQQVHGYYGLEHTDTDTERGSYGAYYSEENSGSGFDRTGFADEERRDRDHEDEGAVGPGIATGDTESGRFRGDANEPGLERARLRPRG